MGVTRGVSRTDTGHTITVMQLKIVNNIRRDRTKAKTPMHDGASDDHLCRKRLKLALTLR
jgi:hypothetical protein